MRLEQHLYEIPRASEQKQRVYFVVGDLESLSATALYTGEPCGKIIITHGGKGMKSINKINGFAYHIFEDGGSHIDNPDGTKNEVKPVNGSNPKGYESTE